MSEEQQRGSGRRPNSDFRCESGIYQSRAGYTDSLVGQLQLRLARAGYYQGAVDGVSGSATRRAIRDYQRAHSLPADGQIRGQLLTSMGLG